MRVTVIGTGYVGLVVGAGFAYSGNDVTCADIDEEKIRDLKEGKLPIFEPGLETLVEENLASGRLAFTTDVAEAVTDADVIFIAVGTPPGEDGSADLSHVLAVARTIGENVAGPTIVVTKSTIPVGTTAKVRAVIRSLTHHEIHVCSNPEFLKEGAAVEDFLKPDRVVIGVESPDAAEVLKELYGPFVRTGAQIIVMDVPSAELTKYAANAMLATRISFMNMISGLCTAAGASVDQVRHGLGSDPRIGPSFLFPGIGYGGSCFPKDVKALIRTFQENGVDAGILEAVEATNDRQKGLLLEGLRERMNGQGLRGRRIAVWGLAFKPNTDDMREAPSLVSIEGLLAEGADVCVHDPVAMDEARRHHLGDRVRYAETNYEALEGAEALLIHTEWHPYRHPDFVRMKASMARPLVLDGRNLWDPKKMQALGWEYVSVGRP
jgi:UDPglucose 6-dehydrogenase